MKSNAQLTKHIEIRLTSLVSEFATALVSPALFPKTYQSLWRVKMADLKGETS